MQTLQTNCFKMFWDIFYYIIKTQIKAKKHLMQQKEKNNLENEKRMGLCPKRQKLRC